MAEALLFMAWLVLSVPIIERTGSFKLLNFPVTWPLGILWVGGYLALFSAGTLVSIDVKLKFLRTFAETF